MIPIRAQLHAWAPRALLAIALSATGLSVCAQTRPDAGTVLETVREPAGLKRPDQGIRVPPPRPRMEAPPGVKVTAKGFRISGHTLYTEAEIQSVLAEFVGKELDFDGLAEAVRAVTAFYRSRGYFLAQAYLPRQELRSGVVEIHVLEGRIGKVGVKQQPNARLKPWIAEGYLRRIESGALATEAGVERPLLLLGDLPATTVQSTLGPGGNVGEADLTAEIGDDGRRVTGVAEVENYGNKYAGAIRFGGQAFLNNAFGIGDQFAVRGLVSQDKLTEVLGLSYSMPVSYWGTKAGFSFAHMQYKLGGSFAPQRASGEADLASILVVHPFIRTRELNLFGQLTGEVKELEDRIDSVLSLEQRRIKSWKLGAFGDSRDFLGGGGINTFSATLTAGKLDLLNPALVTLDANSFRTAGSFNKFNLDVQRVQRVTQALHGVVRVAYQGASKNLTSAEKFSIGGPNGVRGYPVGEGLSDEAFQFSAEARYTIPGFKMFDNELTVAGFIDGAHVRRFREQNALVDLDAAGNPQSNQRTYWGGGVGVRVGKAGGYSLTADLAWRLGSEAPTADIGRHPYFWLRGVIWF